MKLDEELTKEYLESVLKGMKAGLFVIDKDIRIRAFTPRAEKLTGYKKEEALNNKCYDILKTKRCVVECTVRKHQCFPDRPLHYETIATTKSGNELPIDVTMSPLRNVKGETLGAVGIIRDMTERKRLWDTLRKERDRARQYLSIARVTIVALDVRGRVILINKRGCEILGYKEDELIACDWFGRCVPEERREESKRIFQEMIDGANHELNPVELPVLTKGGAERVISWHQVPLKNEEGRITGLLCSGEDITERRQAQAELIRSEKLAAIGQLAAGVAHEVNNPLAGILVYINLFLRKYSAHELQSRETEKQLVKVRSELKRSSRIIKDLLDFSRQSKPSLRPVDINEVIEATLSIVGHQISLGNISLEKNFDAGLPQIVADFDQIQQALMNLILNAAQAMPDGGTLTITTSHDRDVEWGGSRRDAVKIDVTDSGVGIPEEVLDKVFIPFFSTKQKGKGVGLGLAAVEGIIERHKGKIEVKSKLNSGTTISTWLETAHEQGDEDPDRRR